MTSFSPLDLTVEEIWNQIRVITDKCGSLSKRDGNKTHIFMHQRPGDDWELSFYQGWSCIQYPWGGRSVMVLDGEKQVFVRKANIFSPVKASYLFSYEQPSQAPPTNHMQPLDLVRLEALYRHTISIQSSPVIQP